ncbi:MAG: peptide deformylase [Vicinamibacteraceae bacterium]|nr:peptide deformylase [Vicinamibacteraceae bacterium]
MSLLKVARMGHPVLRKTARRLEPTELRTAPLQKLIDDMMETMAEYSGIGLAGPQVHEPLRMFVAGIESDDGRLKVIPFINPEIEPAGDVMEEDWEGCLSIPDIRGRVPRHRDIVVRALDRRGKSFEMALHGFPARVVQHETDHLDGVLFLDRMESFTSLAFLDEYGRFWARDGGEDDAL